MKMTETSMAALTGGQSSKVATSVASAQSAAIAAPTGWPAGAAVSVAIQCDALTFMRYDTNPTALSDGTDQALLANRLYHIDVMPGGKFAFIVPSGTGNVYLTPGA